MSTIKSSPPTKELNTSDVVVEKQPILQSIDEQITKFISGPGRMSFITGTPNRHPLFPVVNANVRYTISDENFVKLINYIDKHYNPKGENRTFSKDDFDFIQKILEQGLYPVSKQNDLLEIFTKRCDNLGGLATDLIPDIRQYLFNHLGPNCWATNIKLVKPVNFEKANMNTLTKILNFARSDNNNGDLFYKSFTQEQKNALKRNPNASNLNIARSGILSANFNVNTATKSSVQSSAKNTTDFESILSTEGKKSPSVLIEKQRSPPSPPILGSETKNIQSQKNITAQKQKKVIPQEVKETVIPTETNRDVSEILNNINKHLERLNRTKDLSFTEPNNILKIGINEISVRCFLHYISENPDFMVKDQTQCSDAIKNLGQKTIQKGGRPELNLEQLLSLSNDFKTDTNFYQNLYGFNIALANEIATSQDFRNTNIATQRKLLENFQKFIRQSLKYLTNYMNEYKVIDGSLIKSSYDLLYLLHIIAFKNVNIGIDIRGLQNVYKSLVDAITNNIEIYNSIPISALENVALSKEDRQLDNEIQLLIVQLQERLLQLQQQGKDLQENVNRLNLSATNISTMARPEIKNIADSLWSQARIIVPQNNITASINTGSK